MAQRPVEFVELRLDATRFLRELDNLLAKPRSVTLKVTAEGLKAVADEIATAAKNRTSEISVEANTTKAAKAIDEVTKKRTVPIETVVVGTGTSPQGRLFGGLDPATVELQSRATAAAAAFAIAQEDATAASADLGRQVSVTAGQLSLFTTIEEAAAAGAIATAVATEAQVAGLLELDAVAAASSKSLAGLNQPLFAIQNLAANSIQNLGQQALFLGDTLAPVAGTVVDFGRAFGISANVIDDYAIEAERAAGVTTLIGKNAGAAAAPIRTLGDVFRGTGREADAFARQGNESVSFLTRAVVIAGAFGAAGLVGNLVKSAAAFEQTTVAFQGLLGSADAADALLEDLRDFAALTPFELPDVTDASKKLLAIRDAAGEAAFGVQDLIPTLTTLGDVAAVLGVGAPQINLVVRAIGQISSKGKVMAEELNQISENFAGFSAISALAAARGESTAATFDAMRKGAVGANEGIDAILEGMRTFPGAANAMAKQSQTLNGILSTLRDNLRNAFIDAFLPAISKITPAVRESFPLIEDFGKAFGDMAANIADLLIPAFKTFLIVGGQIVAVIATAATAITPFVEGLAHISPTVLTVLTGLLLMGKALKGLNANFVSNHPEIARFATTFSKVRDATRLANEELLRNGTATDEMARRTTFARVGQQQFTTEMGLTEKQVERLRDRFTEAGAKGTSSFLAGLQGAGQGLSKLSATMTVATAAIGSFISGQAFARAESGFSKIAAAAGIATTSITSFATVTAATGNPIIGALAGIGTAAAGVFGAMTADADKAKRQITELATAITAEAERLKLIRVTLDEITELGQFADVKKKIRDALSPEALAVFNDLGITTTKILDELAAAGGNVGSEFEGLNDDISNSIGDISPQVKVLFDQLRDLGEIKGEADTNAAILAIGESLGVVGKTVDATRVIINDAVNDGQFLINGQKATLQEVIEFYNLLVQGQRAVASEANAVNKALEITNEQLEFDASETAIAGLKAIAEGTNAWAIALSSVAVGINDADSEFENFANTLNTSMNIPDVIPSLRTSLLELKSPLQDTEAVFADLRDELDAVIDDFLELAGAPIDAARETLEFTAANLALTASLKESTESAKTRADALRGDTEAGIANQEAIFDQVEAAQEAAFALLQQGSSAQDAKDKYADLISQLRTAAIEGGLTTEQFDFLLASVNALPGQVDLTIDPAGTEIAKLKVLEGVFALLPASSQAAIAALETTEEKIARLAQTVVSIPTEKTVEIVGTFIQQGLFEEAKLLIESLPPEKRVEVEAAVFGTDDVKDLDKAIEDTHSKQVEVNARIAGEGDVRRLANLVGGLKDKSIIIQAITGTVSRSAAGNLFLAGEAQAFATGGIVTTPRIPGIFSNRNSGVEAFAHVFAERQLPWEAYISGDPKFRDRSLAIWEQAGELLRAGKPVVRAAQTTIVNQNNTNNIYGSDPTLVVDQLNRDNETKIAKAVGR